MCRDFAHLAVAFCRCMNIPARYCTGYLGDIGVPPSDAPMDFSAWFEVYLGGRWYTFDPRHNMPRIGRISGGPWPRRSRRRDLHHIRPVEIGLFPRVRERALSGTGSGATRGGSGGAQRQPARGASGATRRG